MAYQKSVEYTDSFRISDVIWKLGPLVINKCTSMMWSSEWVETRECWFYNTAKQSRQFLCFLLFLQPFNYPYLWNQLTNFNGVCCNRVTLQMMYSITQKNANWIWQTSDSVYLIASHMMSSWFYKLLFGSCGVEELGIDICDESVDEACGKNVRSACRWIYLYLRTKIWKWLLATKLSHVFQSRSHHSFNVYSMWCVTLVP